MSAELVVKALNNGVLNNVNFSVEKGTLNAVIGANGSGKKSLFESIAGLLNASGEVNFYGTNEKREFNNNISFFSGTFILSKGTTFENIIEPLINLNWSLEIAKGAVYELSKKLELDSILHKQIDELSYSQKKMVAIAKTLIYEPKIIMLDDPFSSLDLSYKNVLKQYLKSLKKSIVLYITYDGESLMYADNIIIVKNNTVIFNSKENLFEDESTFSKSGLKLPFIIDLSHKLKLYNLIDHLLYDSKDMVNELWKSN